MLSPHVVVHEYDDQQTTYANKICFRATAGCHMICLFHYHLIIMITRALKKFITPLNKIKHLNPPPPSSTHPLYLPSSFSSCTTFFPFHYGKKKGFYLVLLHLAVNGSRLLPPFQFIPFPVILFPFFTSPLLCIGAHFVAFWPKCVGAHYDLKLATYAIYVIGTYSLFSRLLHIQLSEPYQFKIALSEVIPKNIKSFELHTPPQSFTQNFLGQNTNGYISWNNHQNKLQFDVLKHLYHISYYNIHCMNYMIVTIII